MHLARIGYIYVSSLHPVSVIGLGQLRKEISPPPTLLYAESRGHTYCTARVANLYSFILRIKLYDLKTEVNQNKVKLKIK